MEEENIITIEKPRPKGFKLFWIWIVGFIFFSFGSLLACYSFFIEFNVFVLLAGLAIMFGAVMNLSLWFSKDIVVIDTNGVYWGKKKRMIPWAQIHGLTCEIEDNSNLDQVNQHVFWCMLKDGEQLKILITGYNYSADLLYQEITSLFPDINCEFRNTK